MSFIKPKINHENVYRIKFLGFLFIFSINLNVEKIPVIRKRQFAYIYDLMNNTFNNILCKWLLPQ